MAEVVEVLEIEEDEVEDEVEDEEENEEESEGENDEQEEVEDRQQEDVGQVPQTQGGDDKSIWAAELFERSADDFKVRATNALDLAQTKECSSRVSYARSVSAVG
jgi:hypothetical protein